MKKRSYLELRKLWFDFYTERGHSVIPSASVVPENDGSVLFTTAGMHPLVPFLLGVQHPAGHRLCNIQKCIRTGDIDEVGDERHLTFFEMMGNWSLGDYFKKEKVKWSFEFLTSEKYLGIPKEDLKITCFEGDEIAPKDEECARLWEEVGIKKEQIEFLGKEDNWWQMPSGTGPCGPDSEMFYKDIEIGNDVYMQYVIPKAGDKVKVAKQRNVDTGMGIERILCLVNGYNNVFESEIFAPALTIIEKNTGKKYKDYEREFRIIAEHTRAAVIMLGDKVVPSSTGQGYVLRRLIRRAIRMAKKIGFERWESLIDFYVKFFEGIYDLTGKIGYIFRSEVNKFNKTIEQGMKEFNRLGDNISGKDAFNLYETYGFPIEVTQELCKERGITVDLEGFETAKKEHSERSQAANKGIFKGGLSDTGEKTALLHTATHLLLAALQKIIDKKIEQRGSNITPERLRFDFNYGDKLQDEEIKKIEDFVNDAIAQKIPIECNEMKLDKAIEMGASGIFHDRYGDVVKVYKIGDISMEICGGPHAKNTGDLKGFKILKDESSSAGVRRIRAVILDGEAE